MSTSVIRKIIPLEDIRENPWNPNQMSQKAWEALGQSLEEFGDIDALIVRSHKGHYQIIDGSHRFRWAKERGVKELPCDVVEVSDTQAKRLTQILNRTRGEDDPAKLKELLDSLVSEIGADEAISGMAIASSEELDSLLEDLQGQIDERLGFGSGGGLDTEDEEIQDVEAKTDKADELQEKWGVERGQIWQLGDHRLMCGDSTDREDVQRLMDGAIAEMCFTDPPYGVNYEGGHFHSNDPSIKRKREKLESDNKDIYSEVMPVIARFTDGPCYTWFADSKALPVYQSVTEIGEIHALIIWHKINAKYAAINAQYKQRHEPCLYWKPKKSTLRWCGATNECTLWEIKRDASNEFHPTQKPIDLAVRAIKNHTAEIVLDLFLGSGTTLIACEQLNRKCRAMEISPGYVAVAIQRWVDLTGKDPILL